MVCLRRTDIAESVLCRFTYSLRERMFETSDRNLPACQLGAFRYLSIPSTRDLRLTLLLPLTAPFICTVLPSFVEPDMASSLKCPLTWRLLRQKEHSSCKTLLCRAYSSHSTPCVAVLHQAIESPTINGVRKPMKPGGTCHGDALCTTNLTRE